MREPTAARILAAVVHELAQPCASAMLAADTCYALAERHGLADAIPGLEAATDEIARLQTRLRLLGLIAAGATPCSLPTDVAAIVAEAVPGAVKGEPAWANVHPDIVRLLLAEMATVCGARHERVQIRSGDAVGTIEMLLSGLRAKVSTLEFWRDLLWVAGIGLAWRERDGGLSVTVSLPSSDRPA